MGPTPVVVGSGALAGSFSLGRWGALLDLGFEGARQGRLKSVRAQAAAQWLSLSLKVAFRPVDALTLDIALGARGWRIAATATGVDVAQDAVHFTVGPVVSAGASWHLLGPLHVHVRPSLALRTPPVQFTVDPLGSVLVLSPWHVGAVAGALVRFE